MIVKKILRDIIYRAQSGQHLNENEKFIYDEWTTKQKSRGLGDTIAKTTEKLGIPQCGSCKQRQQKLNKIFPYKK